jgi:hypothetical protein
MRAREREGGPIVIQRGSLPAAGRVTLGAILAKLSAVPVVGLVAGGAVRRRAAVLVSRVALHAGNLRVSPRKRVGGCVMIKAGSLPAAGPVTLGAVLAKLPVVPVVCLVAGVAILGCSRVLTSCVALGTGNLPVLPGERIYRSIVIEGHGCPASGRVTLGAGLTQLPVVCVLGLVAGVAVLWRPAILVLYVALHAGCLLVLSPERIGSGTVGKGGTLPAVGRMTFCTVPA